MGLLCWIFVFFHDIHSATKRGLLFEITEITAVAEEVQGFAVIDWPTGIAGQGSNETLRNLGTNLGHEKDDRV